MGLDLVAAGPKNGERAALQQGQAAENGSLPVRRRAHCTASTADSRLIKADRELYNRDIAARIAKDASLAPLPKTPKVW